ncbi:hypothetical protein, partial [Pseudomonas sp. AU12215]|uniref:hypothetical protein n=1 Tax=Pseudomonas sp. AU12215 TaxID=1860123 RepID=UPI001C400E47
KPALAEAIAQADLDRDALCGAEFVIGHGATPYRNGRVLHSVFAAAWVLLSLQKSQFHESSSTTP